MKKGIIDCHTHCGIDYCNFYRGRYPLGLSAVQLREISKNHGVDYTITFPVPQTVYYDQYVFSKDRVLIKNNNDACEFPFFLENEYLLSEIKHFNFDSIIPFCSFSLHEKVEEQMEYISCIAEDKRIFGLKYHPFYDGENILKIEEFPGFIKLIERYDLPIICHSGNDANSNPNFAIEFAKRHTNIRVCIAHMGGFEKSIFLDGKNAKNIYYDISPCYSICERLRTAEKDKIFELDFLNPISVFNYAYNLIPNNLMWGTDYPWTYSAKLIRNMSMYYSYADEVKLLNQLDKNIIEKVAWNNAINFLGKNIENLI